MSKASRKAAIEAEMARRDRASGVPVEKQVYVLTPDWKDRGGPRPFVPRVVAEWRAAQNGAGVDDAEAQGPGGLDFGGTFGEVLNLRAMDDDGDGAAAAAPRGPSLPLDVVAAALAAGRPVELAPDPGDGDVADRPLADYSLVDGLTVLSARADAALRPMLGPCCRPVAVACAGHALAGYLVGTVEDVLDAAKCDADWKGFASDIRRFAFFTERLGARAVFRVPQYWKTLVLQPFVDVVRERGLCGFTFRRVWPHSTVKVEG
jgi:hypothetical protein